MADSAGMTLMDLISSDPTPTAPPPPSSSSSASPAAMPPLSSGTVKHATTDQKSKRGTLSQIQSNTISAAKAALNPVRSNILPQKHKQKKKLNLVAGEEVEIEYEVDGWFYVKNKRPGRDGKLAGLVPVLYAC